MNKCLVKTILNVCALSEERVTITTYNYEFDNTVVNDVSDNVAHVVETKDNRKFNALILIDDITGIKFND